MTKYALLILGTVLFVSGCNQGDERLQEKASIEGKATSKANIELENANLSLRVEAMEKDLEARHRFFSSIEGRYLGTQTSETGEKFLVEVNFSPSFPRYTGVKRQRTVEELSYEINNLYLVAQVQEWQDDSELDGTKAQAIGCIFEQVRPGLSNGKVFLASEACKKTYTFYFSEENPNPDTIDVSDFRIKMSRDIASKIMNGAETSVRGLIGIKRTNLSSKGFKLVLKKSKSDIGPREF